MHNTLLAIKRSQSECLVLGPKIYSPLPVNKKASRIGVNVARELFDIPPTIPEFEFELDEAPFRNLYKAKSCIFESGIDSSSMWGLEPELNHQRGQGEFAGSMHVVEKNPSSQDSLSDEVSDEIPSRTSNPIVYDAKFALYDQRPCGFPFYSLHSANGVTTPNL